MKKRIITLILSLALCSVFVANASANNTKLVALTFDDGPNWKYTPVLLDALAERNVHVTFFLVGYSLEVNMDLAQRAYDDGHQLANHSYNHAWFSKISTAKMMAELNSTGALLEEITGKPSYAVRVPYGDITSSVKKNAKAPLIQWSVDPTNGSINATEQNMYKTMLNTVKDGSIILLHDTDKKNLNVAIKSIDALLEQGYEFVTLDELFRLRGVTPENGVVYYSVYQNEDETGFNEALIHEHWAFSFIRSVMKNGLMNGDGTGFKPNEYMTRAMASTILMRLAESTDKLLTSTVGKDSPNVQGFEDVPDGLWFTDAVNWAHTHGYFQGISETLFDPYSYITKEQYYTALARFAAEELSSAADCDMPAVYRDDVRISPWADEGIQLVRDTGFRSLNDPEIFRPLDYMTRAEAAELTSYVMELIETQKRTHAG